MHVGKLWICYTEGDKDTEDTFPSKLTRSQVAVPNRCYRQIWRIFSYFILSPLRWKYRVHKRAVCVLEFPVHFSHWLEFGHLSFLLCRLSFQPIYKTSYIRNITHWKFLQFSSVLQNGDRLHSVFGNSLCFYKSCWKWWLRASIQAWTRLILFANTFCIYAFGNSLCTYKSCWKWCPLASIQAWTRLILFTNTFCIYAFGNSLCTYKRYWKWCPRASIQAWTRLILFANNFYISAFEKLLCTNKRCWKAWIRTVP
jgi:hypothetical protein